MRLEMRILAGELKKHIYNRTIWLLLLSFMVLSVFMFINKAKTTISGIDSKLIEYYKDIPTEDAIILARNKEKKNDLIIAYHNYRSLYQDEKLALEAFLEYADSFYGDPLLTEAVLNMENEVDVYKLYEENQQLYYLINQLEYIKSYNEFILSMDRRTKDMLKSPLFRSDKSYAYRNIIKTQSDFEKMKNIKLMIGNNSGILTFSKFIYADILLITFVFVLCYYIFSSEREQGLFRILKSTVNGHLPLIISKLISLFMLTILGFIVIYGFVIFAAHKMLGFGDLTRYIQSVSEFRDCTLALTVGEYLLCFLSIKLSAILLIALILALFFQLSNSFTLIYLLILGVSFVEYSLYIFIHPASVFNLLKYINIFSFLNTFDNFRIYTNINFFGYPLDRNLITIASIVIAHFALAIINIKIFNLKIQVLTLPQFIGNLIHRRKKSSGSVSLFYHEFYKVFFTGKRFLVIIVLLIISYYSFDRSPLYVERKTSSYLAFINKYEGELTNEKRSLIQEEINYIKNIPNELSKLYTDYVNGNITKEEYQKEFNLLQFELEKNVGFTRFENQFNYLNSLDHSLKPGIVSEVSSDYYFNNPKRDYIYAIYVVLLVIVCVSCIFPIDLQSGMENIIRCTFFGERKLFYVKTLTATILSTVIFIWINFTKYLNLFGKYKISDLKLPVQSIQKYANIEYKISIIGLIIFVSMLTLIAVVMMTQFIILMALLLKKQSLVIICSSVIFLLPLLLGYAGLDTIKFLSISNAFQLYETLADDTLSWANALYFTAVIFITIVITLINRVIYNGVRHR